MDYQCELTDMTAQPTLAVRTRTSIEELGSVLDGAFASVFEYLGELGEEPAGPPYTAYHNDDMENLDIEAGFPVAQELPGRGNIQAREIPGGRAATCIHVGSYGDLEHAYSALTQWVRKHGYEPTWVAYEIYLNDPDESAPEELMTRVVLPLRRS